MSKKYLILLLLLCAPDSHAAPAFVQKIQPVGVCSSGTPAATCAVTFSSNVTAGNYIGVAVSMFTASSVTVADSLGNTFTCLPPREDAGTEWLQFCHAFNSPGGADTVTATFNVGATFSDMVAVEYSGVSAFDNYDEQLYNAACGQGTGTAVIGSQSTGCAEPLTAAATHDTTELVLSIGQSGNYVNWTANSGFTLRSAATSKQIGFADQNGAIGSYQGSFTIGTSTSWSLYTITLYQTDSSTYVQELDHDDGTNVGQATDTVAYYQNVTSGDFLVMAPVWVNNPGTNISSVTDSQGNTWSSKTLLDLGPRGACNGADHTQGQLWYTTASASGPLTVVKHFNNGGGCFIGTWQAEFKGVNTIDQYAAATGSSMTFVTPTVTTTHAGELLISFFVCANGFQDVTTAGAWSNLRAANLRSAGFATQFSQPIGSYSSTFTDNSASSDWGAGILTLFQSAPSVSLGSKFSGPTKIAGPGKVN